MKQYYTMDTDFYRGCDPRTLLERFGSPLYVYSEDILRRRCRDIRQLCASPHYRVNYSTKANSNRTILSIIRDEGLDADAMSPGEIHVLLSVGFDPGQIFYVCNNVSVGEMAFARERGIMVGVDSLSQLETYGQAFPGSDVAVRFNMGFGAGHHEKVVTAGKKTKFGINDDHVDDVRALIRKYDLKLRGINQHIGSLFLEDAAYIESARMLLDLALTFEDLEFVDLGGGFGIPYMKQDGQKRLDLDAMGDRLTRLIDEFVARYGRPVRVKVEPGRYIVAECGVLLGTVHATKTNAGINYVGTDLGFNVLMRPILYDSHHDIEVYREGRLVTQGEQIVTVVGNICESGDKLAIGRALPPVMVGDILGVMDAGAYGYSMASNYNNRLRPAEVLIPLSGEPRLIRRRDTLEDLMRGFAE
ncbi:MAG: diaminopimelate decarboxylase [Christensenellales bacterium]|jgi:diaminopimelate decarboxylase